MGIRINAARPTQVTRREGLDEESTKTLIGPAPHNDAWQRLEHDLDIH